MPHPLRLSLCGLLLGAAACQPDSLLVLTLTSGANDVAYSVYDDANCSAPFTGADTPLKTVTYGKEANAGAPGRYTAGTKLGLYIDASMQKRLVRVELQATTPQGDRVSWCVCPSLPSAGDTLELTVIPQLGVPAQCEKVSGPAAGNLANGELCTSHAQCDSYRCACSSPECLAEERRCAPAESDCPCQYVTPGQAICGGALDAGANDPLSCNGSCVNGWCVLPGTQACGRDEQCLTGRCECADATCSSAVCAELPCEPCDYIGIDGSCTPLTGTVVNPPHCSPGTCEGGTCVRAGDLDLGSRCTEDANCRSLHCACVGTACASRMCVPSEVVCDTCQSWDPDSNTCGPLVLAGRQGEDCETTGLACNLLGDCVSADGASCDTALECASGFCECANITCGQRVCSAIACPCAVNSNGDRTCESAVADGYDDALDRCQTFTCNGLGACHLDLGATCATHELCESGHCEDGVCCTGACSGNCDRCDLADNLGSCIPDSSACTGNCSTCNLDGNCEPVLENCTGACGACIGDTTHFACAADQSACPASGAALCTTCTAQTEGFECTYDETQDADCSQSMICVAAGQCLLDFGATCTADAECAGGKCECADTHCNSKKCSVVTCACQFNGNGDGSCDGTIADGNDDARDTCGPQSCNGQGACHLQNGSPCTAANQCVSDVCRNNGCCGSACTGTCERCDITPGTCTQDASLCSGNCDTCAAGNCAANDNACTGNCDECAGSGTAFNCQAKADTCEASGSTLCTTCLGSATAFNCTYDDSQDGDCGAGNECVAAGSCKASTGSACGQNSDCVSSLCGGLGRCCDPSGPCATDLSAGDAFTCLVATSGSDRPLYCWGSDSVGQLGTATIADGSSSTRPVRTGSLTNASKIDLGLAHACVRTSDATASCWGGNANGQVGDGTIAQKSVPTAIPGLTNVDRVVAGTSHSCALLSGGTVSCWGSNANNQLTSGCGSSECRTPTTASLGGRVFAQLGAGSTFTCGRTSTGGVACWGDNYYGQLGNGESGLGKTSALPVDVKDAPGTGVLGGIIDLAVGNLFSCAINASGVWCWGANDGGQLGNGGTSMQSKPVAVVGLTDTPVAVAAGGRHACAILSSGGISCWGKNDRGQLGNGESGSGVDHPTAVRVGGALANAYVLQLALGTNHSCAVTVSGVAYCWGDGGSGRLGNSNTTLQPLPVLVTWP